MRCQALVKQRDAHCLTGRCYQERGVRVVRWAPTELKTQVLMLCAIHRAYVERHGKIEAAK